MKNFMNKVSVKANEITAKGYVMGLQAKERVRSVLTQKSGEGFVDTALVRHVSI